MRALLLAVLLATLTAGSADAAYRFAVPEAQMIVRIQPDASVDVEYTITFENDRSGQPIDIVDIGMPNPRYDMGSMSALVNGVPAGSIRRSEFVVPGVETHLGPHAIGSGESGVFTFRFHHEDLVFSDTTDDDLASFRITPTWFGGEFVLGHTDLTVGVILPPGVTPEQVKHHAMRAFDNKAVTGEGTLVTFHWPQTRFTTEHLIGVSFPITAMERVVRISRWQLLVEAVEQSEETRVILFGVLFVLAAFAFFRFSGGTGFVVFLVLIGVLGVASMNSAAFQILAVPGALVAVAANEALRKRRLSKYLPPIAQIEGGGIKRGLTAPEAAVMLEEPLGKVLSLVIFGLLKKEVVAIESHDPMCLRVVADFELRGESARTRPKTRRALAQKRGIALRKYEEPFLQVIEDGGYDSPLSSLDFTDALKRLIEITAARLEGFDLSDTQDYYRQIIKRALIEAESTVPATEEAESTMDRSLEWILLSERPGDVFDRYHYRPPWRRHHGHYGGHGLPSGLPGGKAPSPGGDKGWSPSVGDAAAGYAGWAENVFGDLAGSILPGKISDAGGILDLSGVDRVTGEILAAMAENSGGGGGGGGGGGSSCACACAGCACACACAGGGR